MAGYTEFCEAGQSPIVESLSLTKDEARAEALFLGLRMMRGISAEHHQKRFGIDLREQHEQDLTRFREAGLIEFEGDLIKLTRSGALLSNEVFAAFV